MRARLGLLYGLLLWAAGCANQSSTPSAEAPPPEPRSLLEFCHEWAINACSAEVVGNCQARSERACRMRQAKFCVHLVDGGFSDRDGRACTDAVAAAYADGRLLGPELSTVLELGTPCDRIRVGPKGPGEQCAKSHECDRSEGYDCVRKANAAHGSCQIPEKTEPGRKCKAAQATCDPGFYCDGEHCVEVEGPGEFCMIDAQCGDAGYCSRHKCAARKGVGDSCDASVECQAGICSELGPNCRSELGPNRVCTNRIVLSRAEPVCNHLK